MTELIYGITLAGVVVVSYLIGNISWAGVLSKKRGKDIKNQGSGNPGTMNMLRTFGFKMAILTLILDVLKGVVPAVAAYYIMQTTLNYGASVSAGAPAILGYYTGGVGKLYAIIAGFSAVVGHIFPVFAKFKGGKGVGTTIGMFLVLNPLPALGLFIASVLYLTFFKYGSISSFIVVIGMCIFESVMAVVFKDNIVVIVFCVLTAALILWAHRTNIKRLLNGTESNSNLIEKARKNKARKQAESITNTDNTNEINANNTTISQEAAENENSVKE